MTGSAEGQRPLYDEERETKFRELRAVLFQSIANGGEASETDINAALDAKARQLQKEGFKARHGSHHAAVLADGSD